MSVSLLRNYSKIASAGAMRNNDELNKTNRTLHVATQYAFQRRTRNTRWKYTRNCCNRSDTIAANRGSLRALVFIFLRACTLSRCFAFTNPLAWHLLVDRLTNALRKKFLCFRCSFLSPFFYLSMLLSMICI